MSFTQNTADVVAIIPGKHKGPDVDVFGLLVGGVFGGTCRGFAYPLNTGLIITTKSVSVREFLGIAFTGLEVASDSTPSLLLPGLHACLFRLNLNCVDARAVPDATPTPSNQVWSLTLFYPVDFSQSRIGVKK